MKASLLLLFFSLAWFSCKQSHAVNFDLSTLSSEWIKLTQKDGKLIIYNSCDAGNLLLSITEQEKNYNILLHGQQENIEFDVLQSILIGDSVVVKTKWKHEEDVINFRFVWQDKENGIGRWVIPNSGDLRNILFVDSMNEDNFEQIDQPCRECWGDECDEITRKDISTISHDSVYGIWTLDPQSPHADFIIDQFGYYMVDANEETKIDHKLSNDTLILIDLGYTDTLLIKEAKNDSLVLKRIRKDSEYIYTRWNN